MFRTTALTIARTIAAGAALGLLLAPPQAGAAPANEPPSASFEVSPAYPVPGETVTFTSTSSDPDGRITSLAWDLDGDGRVDERGERVTWTYVERGAYRVRLDVSDNRGGSATWFRRVTVNRAPAAAFEIAPSSPAVGETVTFTSRSSDPDGPIAAEEWDLDDDGEFDDATGQVAAFAYASEGPRRASLRVTDDLGGVSTWAVDFVVGPPAPGAAPVTPSGTPAWLTPFPTVRIAGRTTRRGARVTILAVRAPAGAQIVVRCVGRRCPAKTRRATVTDGARPVRIRSFERRLAAGLLLSVRVTKDGVIGKYTRFRFRRVKPPVRWEGCLMPGAAKPVECPAS